MRFFELACSGSFEMSSFHGLSGGNTCKAARILSASGVWNSTGFVTAGILGSGRPLECLTEPSASSASATLAVPWLQQPSAIPIPIQRHSVRGQRFMGYLASHYDNTRPHDDTRDPIANPGEPSMAPEDRTTANMRMPRWYP